MRRGVPAQNGEPLPERWLQVGNQVRQKRKGVKQVDEPNYSKCEKCWKVFDPNDAEGINSHQCEKKGEISHERKRGTLQIVDFSRSAAAFCLRTSKAERRD